MEICVSAPFLSPLKEVFFCILNHTNIYLFDVIVFLLVSSLVSSEVILLNFCFPFFYIFLLLHGIQALLNYTGLSSSNYCDDTRPNSCHRIPTVLNNPFYYKFSYSPYIEGKKSKKKAHHLC